MATGMVHSDAHRLTAGRRALLLVGALAWLFASAAVPLALPAPAAAATVLYGSTFDANCTYAPEGASVVGGTWAASVDDRSGVCAVAGNFPIGSGLLNVPGVSTYTVSLDVRTVSGTAALSILWFGASGSLGTTAIGTANTSWSTVQGTAIAPAGTLQLRVNRAGSQTLQVDDFVIQDEDGTPTPTPTPTPPAPTPTPTPAPTEPPGPTPTPTATPPADCESDYSLNAHARSSYRHIRLASDGNKERPSYGATVLPFMDTECRWIVSESSGDGVSWTGRYATLGQDCEWWAVFCHWEQLTGAGLESNLPTGDGQGEVTVHVGEVVGATRLTWGGWTNIGQEGGVQATNLGRVNETAAMCLGMIRTDAWDRDGQSYAYGVPTEGGGMFEYSPAQGSLGEGEVNELGWRIDNSPTAVAGQECNNYLFSTRTITFPEPFTGHVYLRGWGNSFYNVCLNVNTETVPYCDELDEQAVQGIYSFRWAALTGAGYWSSGGGQNVTWASCNTRNCQPTVTGQDQRLPDGGSSNFGGGAGQPPGFDEETGEYLGPISGDPSKPYLWPMGVQPCFPPANVVDLDWLGYLGCHATNLPAYIYNGVVLGINSVIDLLFLSEDGIGEIFADFTDTLWSVIPFSWWDDISGAVEYSATLAGEGLPALVLDLDGGGGGIDLTAPIEDGIVALVPYRGMLVAGVAVIFVIKLLNLLRSALMLLPSQQPDAS